MLKIHFLNVGHGDCIIVEFCDNDRIAMIDINRSSEMDKQTKSELISEALGSVNDLTKSYFKLGIINEQQLLVEAKYSIDLQDPIEYINDNGLKPIFRFISTHPHMDHLSGLAELNSTNNISVLWIVKNTYEQNEDKLSESQKVDWNFYKKYRDTNEEKIDGIQVIRPTEGDLRDFWKQDGIYILAPNNELIEKSNSSGNANILSYVLIIKYGVHKIVLGGDAEEDTWKHITENHEELIKDTTILKASHHGRDSGYYQPAVKIMSPQYTIVSVGKKPNTDASNKYRQYSKNVWSTRWKGNIRFELTETGGSYFTQYDR